MDAMLLVKATMLLAATLLAARLLRRAPAATRHRLWTLAFAAVLALPVLAMALPPLRVPVLAPGPARATVGPAEAGPHVPTGVELAEPLDDAGRRRPAGGLRMEAGPPEYVEAGTLQPCTWAPGSFRTWGPAS
jgi:hypothetical protein